MTDIWVVRTEQLVPMIERHILEHTEPRAGYTTAKDPVYDPLGDLAKKVEISTRVLYSIRHLEREFVEWHLADRILSVIDRNDAIRNGEIEVIPNPRLSRPTFERRLGEALASAA